MPRIIVLDQAGADTGAWTLGDDGTTQAVTDWAPEQTAELLSALAIIREGSNLTTPGLAETVTRTVTEHLSRNVTAWGDGEKVIVLSGPTLGRDGPEWVLTLHADGTFTIEKTPGGWGVDVIGAVNILRYSARLRTPELVEAATTLVADVVLAETAVRFAHADTVVFG